MVDRKLYRYKDAAELLSISVRALQRAVTAGQLQAVPAPGTTGAKGMRISGKELDRYISSAQRVAIPLKEWKRRAKAADEERGRTA